MPLLDELDIMLESFYNLINILINAFGSVTYLSCETWLLKSIRYVIIIAYFFIDLCIYTTLC